MLPPNAPGRDQDTPAAGNTGEDTMPTHIPVTGGTITSATEWETLLAQLEQIRATVAHGSAALDAHGTAVGELTTRVKGLVRRVQNIEHMIGAAAWHFPDQPAQPGVLAAIAALDARLARLETAAERGSSTGDDLVGLLEARVPEHLGHQVEDIHMAVHRPGERPRTFGGGLAAAVADLERTLVSQGEALGRWQGGAASVPGALAALRKEVAALERQQTAVADALAHLEAAQRAGGDQLARLLVQQDTRLAGDDAISLLTRLLASPTEVLPHFRRDQFVVFVPDAVNQWLTNKGLARRDAARVRAVWRDAGYVPSEQKGNLNKRVPIPGVKAPPYYMVVPTLTYAKLRVPVPSDLPTNPPAGRPAVNAAVD